jgi:hypothetical protein
MMAHHIPVDNCRNELVARANNCIMAGSKKVWVDKGRGVTIRRPPERPGTILVLVVFVRLDGYSSICLGENCRS